MPPAALGKGAFSDYLPESRYIPANVEATSGDLTLGGFSFRPRFRF
jgi:hypothetical protein